MRATSTTASASPRLMSFTPFAGRPRMEMLFTGERMMMPLRVMIITSSSSITSLTATRSPLRASVEMAMTPLPPRLMFR